MVVVVMRAGSTLLHQPDPTCRRGRVLTGMGRMAKNSEQTRREGRKRWDNGPGTSTPAPLPQEAHRPLAHGYGKAHESGPGSMGSVWIRARPRCLMTTAGQRLGLTHFHPFLTSSALSLPLLSSPLAPLPPPPGHAGKCASAVGQAAAAWARPLSVKVAAAPSVPSERREIHACSLVSEERLSFPFCSRTKVFPPGFPSDDWQSLENPDKRDIPIGAFGRKPAREEANQDESSGFRRAEPPLTHAAAPSPSPGEASIGSRRRGVHQEGENGRKGSV